MDADPVAGVQPRRVEAGDQFLDQIFGLTVGQRLRRIGGVDEDLVTNRTCQSDLWEWSETYGTVEVVVRLAKGERHDILGRKCIFASGGQRHDGSGSLTKEQCYQSIT